VRSSRFVLVLVASLALLLPSISNAGEPDASEAPAAATRWYGWQSLPADAVALTALGLLLSTGADHAIDRDRWLTLGALGLYAFGAPFVHAMNGHGRRAVGSLSLRVSIPLVTGLVGGVVGYATTPARGPFDNRCNDCAPLRALGGTMIGVGFGIVTSIIVDDLVLARETVPVSAPRWSFTAAPSSASGGLSLGVAGTW
jgi:hypothetical protein